MSEKIIEIKMQKNSEDPKYLVTGDGGHTIYGLYKNFDEAKRAKEELEKRIDLIHQAKFRVKKIK